MPLRTSGRTGPSFCGDCLAIVATNCTVVTLRSTGTEGPQEGEIQSRWTDVNTESDEVGTKFAASGSVSLQVQGWRSVTDGRNSPLSDCSSGVLKELSKDYDRLRIELRDVIRGPRVEDGQNCEAFKDCLGWCAGLTKSIKSCNKTSLKARTFWSCFNNLGPSFAHAFGTILSGMVCATVFRASCDQVSGSF